MADLPVAVCRLQKITPNFAPASGASKMTSALQLVVVDKWRTQNCKDKKIKVGKIEDNAS